VYHGHLEAEARVTVKQFAPHWTPPIAPRIITDALQESDKAEETSIKHFPEVWLELRSEEGDKSG
jgi:hypothetical protein